MMHTALWNERLFRETAGMVIVFLLTIGTLLYVLRQQNPRLTAAWVSAKSWIFAAPVFLFFVGLPYPWTLVVLCCLSILSAKTFFQMVGMYHRTWFVWLTYFFIGILGAMIYYQQTSFFNLMPMIFLFCCCFIPFLRNSYSNMIQYIALSLLCFIFMGWAIMHIGLILSFEKGIYVVLYLYILAEINFNSALFYGRFFGNIKMLDKISPKLTVEGIVFSTFVTVLLAWGMRHMLPIRSEPYWMSAAGVVVLFSRCGDLILAVIRRDLGIKESGVFIIGRDDILARVDKFIFAAPLFYYLFQILEVLFPKI